jgi:outer membrane protein
MASAYWNNPQLNAERARQRATDENVPQALAAFRPALNAVSNTGRTFSGPQQNQTFDAGVSVEQTVFSGFRNVNRLKGAESSVLAGQETLRDAEQIILLDAVTAFMDVVQAQAELNLRGKAVEFYRAQLQSTQSLLNTGEATRVDVSQVNARLASAQSDYYQALATLNSAIATYQQVVGHAPTTMGVARSVDALLPLSVAMALDVAFAQHPTIAAASFAVEIAAADVKVAEGALLPNVTVSGSVTHRDSSVANTTNAGALSARLTVPIWDGGANTSRVRATKEVLAQRRLQLDIVRDQVRQNVVSIWGLLDAAKSMVRAADAQASAQQRLLADLIEQRKAGQATTLNVLDGQQGLVTAQISQVEAQHDRVLYSYALLAAMGQLTALRLGLAVDVYQPFDHYDLVRDKLGGIRTPDGR